MVVVRYFSSDSFLKLLYNQKDKDEMPNFTTLTHTNLLFESTGSLGRVAMQANKCFQDQRSSLETLLQSVIGNKGSSPGERTTVMIDSKGLGFFLYKPFRQKQCTGSHPCGISNFRHEKTKRMRSRRGTPATCQERRCTVECNEVQSPFRNKAQTEKSEESLRKEIRDQALGEGQAISSFPGSLSMVHIINLLRLCRTNTSPPTTQSLSTLPYVLCWYLLFCHTVPHILQLQPIQHDSRPQCFQVMQNSPNSVWQNDSLSIQAQFCQAALPAGHL